MATAAQTAGLSGRAKERLERTRIIERYALARTTVRVAGWVGGALFAWLTIRELAGQQTSVTFSAALSVLAQAKVAFFASIAGAASIWAIVERRLRLRKTEYLQNRIIQLEKEKDPQRSSSHLTLQGKTNPRDKRK